ncbi:MAG TPA: DUF4124 domain-containing protein [Nevskiaceae bacterium]|nr:DUF4124 domain-containing protein [Nevskiaceae bacterium]
MRVLMNFTAKMFLTAAALLGGTAFAGVYKWVDADGRVHYGDRPPANAGAQAVSVGAIPSGLEERLRALDPDFSITRLSGDLKETLVCGEFDAHGVRDAQPRFLPALKASGLAEVLPDEGQPTVRGQRAPFYDRDRCPPPAPQQRLAQRSYRIQFTPDAIAAYGNAGSGRGCRCNAPTAATCRSRRCIARAAASTSRNSGSCSRGRRRLHHRRWKLRRSRSATTSAHGCGAAQR